MHWGVVMDKRKVLLYLGPLVSLMLVFGAPVAQAACKDRPSPGVDWTKCDKERKILRKQDLSGAVLKWTDFSGSDLSEATLIEAVLIGANFSRARLRRANLEHADLSKARGDRTDFEAANLAGAVLSKAELPRANLSRADLTDTDLSKAELGRADLTGANLRGANLRFANLARATFTRANLAGVDLKGAYTLLTRFQGADLSQTLGLIQDQLDLACGDADTKLPQGLKVPGSWPCAEDS